MGTVTLLFSDIEGSTTLARQLGERWPAVLDAHYALLRRAVANHGGVEAGTAGDGLLAAFMSARDAVRAADAQRALAAHDWPAGTTVRVRMGLHTGERVLTPDGYAGLDAHRGARVMSAAHGGQVLLTAAVVEIVGADLPPAARLRDLGEYRLKDFPKAERLFQLVVVGLPETFPPPHAMGGLPTNLPRPRTPLVGRQREKAQLAALLGGDDRRLVTMTGPGGVGKTRLAMQVASELLPRLSGGAFVVELAAIREPALVMPTLAGVLGVRERPGEAVTDALARELADRELLLVLDNFEQVVDAAPALGGLLAATTALRLLAQAGSLCEFRENTCFPSRPSRPQTRPGSSSSARTPPGVL